MSLHAIVTVLAAEGAEVSKTPFYLAGGLLAGWAVLVSALGLARPDFPGSGGGARAVMGISAVLVLGTLAAAVATSSKPHEEKQAEARSPSADHDGRDASGRDNKEAEPVETVGQSTAPEPAETTPEPSGAATANLALAADPSGQLKYSETALEATAGQVVIDFTNQAPVPHDVAVEGGGKVLGKSETITGGETKLDVELPAGEYEFFCTVDSHRQLGMKGKLTVK